jgi:hypothetical protein
MMPPRQKPSLKKLAQASKSNKTKNHIFLAFRRAEWQYLGRKPEVFAFSGHKWSEMLDSERKQAYLAPETGNLVLPRRFHQR